VRIEMFMIAPSRLQCLSPMVRSCPDPQPHSDRRSVGKAPTVDPTVSPLLNARLDSYPAFVAAKLTVHQKKVSVYISFQSRSRIMHA
jgi:hypothetical protein